MPSSGEKFSRWCLKPKHFATWKAIGSASVPIVIFQEVTCTTLRCKQFGRLQMLSQKSSELKFSFLWRRNRSASFCILTARLGLIYHKEAGVFEHTSAPSARIRSPSWIWWLWRVVEARENLPMEQAWSEGRLQVKNSITIQDGGIENLIYRAFCS